MGHQGPETRKVIDRGILVRKSIRNDDSRPSVEIQIVSKRPHVTTVSIVDPLPSALSEEMLQLNVGDNTVYQTREERSELEFKVMLPPDSDHIISYEVFDQKDVSSATLLTSPDISDIVSHEKKSTYEDGLDSPRDPSDENTVPIRRSRDGIDSLAEKHLNWIKKRVFGSTNTGSNGKPWNNDVGAIENPSSREGRIKNTTNSPNHPPSQNQSEELSGAQWLTAFTPVNLSSIIKSIEQKHMKIGDQSPQSQPDSNEGSDRITEAVDYPNVDNIPTILIADDDPELLEVYSSWISDVGPVVTATTGGEAISLINHSTELVLLNRRLPDIGGKEVIEWIHKQNIDCRIVVISGIDPTFNPIFASIDQYIVKPISREDLLGTVNQFATTDRKQAIPGSHH